MDAFVPDFIRKTWEDLELEHLCGPPPPSVERVDDLVVVGGAVSWATPGREGNGVFTHDVPDGTHPVYAGVRASGGGSAAEPVRRHVTALLVPVAEPARLAEAAWDEGYGDMGADLADHATLWSGHAQRMALPHRGEHRHPAITRAERRLRSTSAPTDRLTWTNEVVDPETGANMVSFPVWDGTNNAFEARSADGGFLALLYVTWSA
ncbi:hypothetical protein [Saccharothrix obliqua]|uniref:hypothetical protein n=1 Tax=Saccharothrix obliqua TaxID=2861747 RepID=UPI001C5FB612|nr:hypothetical protein [Saccharothrix obliqua]MBW4718624.1 hypothetical protein [Saccharothrix obliqua]